MNKIISKIKNWWNPCGYVVSVDINTYEFKPKEDITAYELHICNTRISVLSPYDTAIGYQTKMNQWYNALSENCKRHFVPYVQKCIEYKKW